MYPGSFFEYASCCPMQTTTGNMEGKPLNNLYLSIRDLPICHKNEHYFRYHSTQVFLCCTSATHITII